MKFAHKGRWIILAAAIALQLAAALSLLCYSARVRHYALAHGRIVRKLLHLSFARIRLNPKLIGNIIATGLPSLIRQGLNSACTILMNFTKSYYSIMRIKAKRIRLLF